DLLQTGVALKRDAVPVIETGAAQVTVVQAKAQPPDQVQGRSRGGTESGHIAGIRRNFRFPQRHVQHRCPRYLNQTALGRAIGRPCPPYALHSRCDSTIPSPKPLSPVSDLFLEKNSKGDLPSSLQAEGSLRVCNGLRTIIARGPDGGLPSSGGPRGGGVRLQPHAGGRAGSRSLSAAGTPTECARRTGGVAGRGTLRRPGERRPRAP